MDQILGQIDKTTDKIIALFVVFPIGNLFLMVCFVYIYIY